MNRWKVTVVILLVWLLVATGLGGYVQSQNIEQRNQVAGLQEQVATLENQNKNLLVEITDLKSEIKILREEVDNLKDYIRNQVTSLQNQIITLGTQNEDLSVDIQDLKSENKNLLLGINDLKSQIEVLRKRLDNLKDYLPFLDISEMEATVVRVIDGDTIEVDIIGMRYKVRYIGIDTPELHDKRPEFCALAQEATRLNRELVEGKTVRLEKDVSGTDNFGRLLRYVYVDGIFVNAELVREGLAWAEAYEPDIKYQDYLEELETEAKQAGRGLWAPTLSPG